MSTFKFPVFITIGINSLNLPKMLYDTIEKNMFNLIKKDMAQSVGAAEYTDCISAEVLRLTQNKCPRYDTKQSDGEASIPLELWEMWSTLLLLSLQGPLCPRVVAPDWVLSMGQIELSCVLMQNWIV